MAPMKRHQGGHKPTPGSVMPEQIREELNQLDQDDRKFSKRFVNKAANRKEQRKQKRMEKTQRRQTHQQQTTNAKRHLDQRQDQPGKRVKTNDQQPSPASKAANAPAKKKVANSSDKKAYDKLAISNPHLHSLLDNDRLLDNDKTPDDLFAEDDQFIEYWEKKLGMNKSKKFDKAFEKDGLMDVLGDLANPEKDDDSDDDTSGLDYLQQKRQQQKAKAKAEKHERQAESAVDDMFGGLESSDEDDSDESVFSEGDEDVSMDEDDDIESESDDNEPSETEDQHEPAKDEEQTVAASALPATSKYVPPHLRKMATTKSEQQIRLQRQLQGLLNKLSESNMEMILVDIEKLYGVYPRHDVNTTVTELILTSISQKANLLDSFVILYATIVASLYRLIGIEFAAHFVQTLVESFEKYYKQSQEAIERGDEVGEDGPVGTREARNLLTLILELYNFQVVACILVYDLIRSLIGQMHEQSVELLLKIVRTCGAQMRTDDPASLKDVIDAIQKESAKRDPKTISVRHKFMLETLTNIKNNKIKSSEVSARQADKDMVVKMKKFLTGLTKKRATRSAEPLRVSLEDIHEIETKGKWWLVGASWRANLVGTESEHAKKKQDTKVASDLKKDQSMQQTLLKLARKQGMNTDVRRSIFVSLMGAEDYVDAYEKLNKLGLSEVQQREIPRVILQCSGNEKTFNPYYVFVSERMCQLNHSYKVTFQYCLWDFLRDLGLQDIGGLERTSSSGSEVRLNRIVNLGKFFGMLFAKQTLSLSILRTINFISLTQKAQVFLDIVFSHMLLQLKDNVQDLKEVFFKIAQLPALSQGILLHLQGSLLKGKRTGLSSSDLEIVREQCHSASIILKALPTHQA